MFCCPSDRNHDSGLLTCVSQEMWASHPWLIGEARCKCLLAFQVPLVPTRGRGGPRVDHTAFCRLTVFFERWCLAPCLEKALSRFFTQGLPKISPFEVSVPPAYVRALRPSLPSYPPPPLLGPWSRSQAQTLRSPHISSSPR